MAVQGEVFVEMTDGIPSSLHLDIILLFFPTTLNGGGGGASGTMLSYRTGRADTAGPMRGLWVETSSRLLIPPSF